MVPTQPFIPMNFRVITWGEFDEALSRFPKPICNDLYAVPRGGLVLGVALSHRFNKPLVSVPNSMSILVDDIADSGKTLRDIRLVKRFPLPAYVLCKRYTCTDKAITSAIEIDNDDWIVFPWENLEQAEKDYEQYKSTRK